MHCLFKFINLNVFFFFILILKLVFKAKPENIFLLGTNNNIKIVEFLKISKYLKIFIIILEKNKVMIQNLNESKFVKK